MGGSTVTAEAKKIDPLKGKLNNEHAAVLANIERNIRRPLPQIQPHMPQDAPIGIIAGGPSLIEFEDEIRRRHADGLKLVSVNGTHDWLVERGIRPSAHIMVDSRPFNARFVKNWQIGTKYLLAAQCHPRAFDLLEGADVWVFHSGGDSLQTKILEDHYLGNCYITPGGSTVVLRGIQVLRMLGFTHMEIWGFDSCLMGDKHHAYPQKENDRGRIAEIEVEGKMFRCEPWMVSQANEFAIMAQAFGDLLHLVVHGDGLIAHMINTHADLLEETENG